MKWLLYLYPAEYRRSRGPELLATLEEAASDGRPEFFGLALGALRAHASHAHRGSWLAATRVAALTVLVSTIVSAPLRIGFVLSVGPSTEWEMFEPDLPGMAALPFGLVAVVAILHGRYRSAAVAAAAAFGVAATVLSLQDGAVHGAYLRYPVAAVLLLPLFSADPRPARGLLRYVPLLPLLYVAADHREPLWAGGDIGIAIMLCIGAALWTLVDERVPIAVGLFLLSHGLVQILAPVLFTAHAGDDVPPVYLFSTVFTAIPPALLLTVAVFAVRRRAHL
ncbi:hypothetical protein [Cryptosporangium minutisporangium]|uniref:Uncharacterized protein n=1 Tax=Cryptosporangium minutisporangium TaxID=113569 RepID=A0ABP6T9Y8_9ACTN